MSTLVFDLDAAMAGSDLPLDTLDPLLSYANGGGLMSWDLQAGGYSYPSTANPANGAAVRDLSEASGLDSVVTLGGTGAIVRAGNGFAFDNVVNPGHRIEGPASAATAIWGGGGIPQYFLVLVYMRLPSKANWPTTANFTRPVSFLTFTTTGGGFVSENDLVNMNFVATSANLSALRPTAGTAARDQLNIVPAEADYGSVVQLAFWRNAAGQSFRLRSRNGILRQDAASGANNSESFAGKRMQLGIGAGNWKSATLDAGKEMRIYRAYMESLHISGRNPEAVANEDFDSVFRVRALPFS